MKHSLLLIFILFCIFHHISAQYIIDTERTQNPTSSYHLCGTEKHDISTHPELAMKRMHDDEQIRHNSSSSSSRATHQIPMVFHIIYNDEADNVSDEQIYAQLQELNYCFSASNHGISKVPTEFPIGDMDIEFCLATVDPDGNPTTGITRKQTSLPHFSKADEEMKFNSSGGVDAWDTQKYMNIWVCVIEEGILGYGQFPYSYDTDPLTDGVAVLPRTITSHIFPNRNSGLYGMGRTFVHEVGHNLGLYHLWGGDAECTDTDAVDDTPNQATHYFQQVSIHPVESCGSNDMFMNHMCYPTDDHKLAFTPGQVTRVYNVINYYPHLTGKVNHGSLICGTAAPLASFEAPASGCAPYSADIKFRTISEPSSWSWSFPGGTPASFSGQTPPNINYATPGTYSINLTVSNDAGQHTESKEITIYECANYDCNSSNNLNGQTVGVFAFNNNNGFLTGHNNYEDAAIAEHFTNIPDNSIVDGIEFEFQIASGSGDIEFFIRADNNGSPGEILYRDTKTASSVMTDANNDASTMVDFGGAIEVPNSLFVGVQLLDYQDTEIALRSNNDGTTIPGTAWVQARNGIWASIKQANNVDISTGITINYCTPNTAVSTLDLETQAISIFPNPAHDIISIEGIQEGEYEFFDVSGKLLQEGNIQREINISPLRTGIYFIRINDGNNVKVSSFVKE